MDKCSLFQAKSLSDVDPSSPSQFISPFRKPLESIGNNVHSSVQPSLSAHVSISRNMRVGVISSSFTPGLDVIKLEYSLRLKIKRNDWLLADMCPQAANHCALF